MTDREAALELSLVEFHSEYVDLGERTCEILRMVGERPAALVREQVEGLAEAAVDEALAPGHADREARMERALRVLMLRHAEAVAMACRALAEQGFETDEPHAIHANGVRVCGIEDLLLAA